MTGKEALEEVKDTHITKWDEKGIYTMNFKDTISYKILENEMDRLEKADKELAKYKKAFEVFKGREVQVYPKFDGNTQYLITLNKEKYELLEELMSDGKIN